jgi:serine protease Do
MHALGSGFIVSADGYIVTNNHVVSRADEITVILDDGTRLPAELKAVDQKTDLALLKVAADKELPFVAFGDSEKSRVGDWVIAIGNPFGLGGTTTTGIISARGRDLNSGPLDDFIQVDAPINQGNSGGPLFNLQGQVIGINTAIFSPNGGSVGIGFAIPSSIGANVVAQLQADGKVSRGWLGVQIQQVSEDIAATLDLDKSRGALVAKVVTDSPASKAGVLAGDVILSFDGQAVENMKELPKIVANTAANKTVAMEIWRNGSKQIIEVVTGVSQPEQLAAAQQPAANKAKLGLELAQLTPELRQRYQLDRKIEGVLITGVEPQSPAAENGLRGGDVIKMVGRTQVSSPGEVLDEINRISEASRKAVLLLVSRGGNDRFVALEIV